MSMFACLVLRAQVLPGLYVGNYRDSKDSLQLERFEITHIVAIHDTPRKLHLDKHYLCVMASDTPDQNLTHLAGMSRSVTVAVAYIMSVTTLNWKEALKVVRVGRSVANPNFGFQKQLQEFEAFKLLEERRRMKERFPSLLLANQDEEQCRLMLHSYQSLILSRDLCEGDCSLGQTCPTGLCRSPSKSYGYTEPTSTAYPSKWLHGPHRKSAGQCSLDDSSTPVRCGSV
uniref:Tyrosine-protein phosphatase domain-containing protein n=1 Tax=Timema poppense TaxID=170557 RepID=A0A7R9CUM8_TIMPO|nr:unnamed protein product [Timema poppensis]